MRWNRHYDYRPPARPKARTLTADEKNKLVLDMTAAIGRSPILTAFRVQVETSRGRFYLTWEWDPDSEPHERSSHGRITPLDNPSGQFLLEVQYTKNRWSEVATGSPDKLIQVVADDRKGTFHGLGSVDESLRRAAEAGLARLPVEQASSGEFIFAETKKSCTVQETLYHFFELPVPVIAQPAGWYSCHRTPRIVEFTKDKTGVLVRFTAISWSGESFGGTCLYLNRNGRWAAYTIRPNQSADIHTAEAWLAKRNWVSWS